MSRRSKASERTEPGRPKVVLGNAGTERMFRGADKLAHLLGLTLGPVAGNIVSAKDGSERYETLTDAATIARRIIAIPEPTEDTGAMMLRQIVWRVRQRIGDGSATAAVLARAIMHEGRRMIVAGANPMLVRQGIELGVAAAVKALQEMAEPLEGQERLAALATAACGDEDIGRVVGEIYDTLGPDAVVNIQEFVGYYTDRAYMEGSRFEGNIISRFFLTDTTHRLAELKSPYILISDWNLNGVEQVQPLLELIMTKGEGRPLLVISATQEGTALTALLANHQKKVLQICGAKIKGIGDPWRAALEDLALITGGRFIFKAAGLAPSEITLDDLGQAERVEVSEDYVTVFQGAGDRKAIRQRSLNLRQQLREAKDTEEEDAIRKRLGWLGSGIGILKIGAITQKDRKLRRERAEQAIRVVAAGYEGGAVPGGGAAYLACIPAVLAVEAEGDVAFGVQAVARALEAPLKQIVINAGMDPSVALARAKDAGPGYGIEVRSEKVVDMRQAGVMDSTRVLEAALEAGASGASMILTTGAIILHRKPELSVEP